MSVNYKYCNKENFEDFSCGRVIYHRTGMPNFPVRLSQEIYSRCLHYLENKNNLTIFDPCCGGGYLLTVLGFLNMDSIKEIYGSDIASDAVELARSNLSLLNEEGLENRMRQLHHMYEKFNKDSHKGAIDSSKRMLELIKAHSTKPKSTIFKANVFSKKLIDKEPFKADLVITDVPYGNLVSWQGEDTDPINAMLINLIPILKPTSVVAICSNKKQKIMSTKFKRLEKQLIGKRKFEILTLNQ